MAIAARIRVRYNRGYTMDMKTAVSLPDPVFRSADRLAARLGVSRSELYCRAIKELLARHEDAAVTEQLDALYGEPDVSSSLDPELAQLQSATLARRDRR